MGRGTGFTLKDSGARLFSSSSSTISSYFFISCPTPQFLPVFPPPSTSLLHALLTQPIALARACSATYRLELVPPRVSPTKGTRFSPSFLSASQTQKPRLGTPQAPPHWLRPEAMPLPA